MIHSLYVDVITETMYYYRHSTCFNEALGLELFSEECGSPRSGNLAEF